MSFREEYRNQVRLLLRVMPIVARETCFALKGGTAINLFIRNLPQEGASNQLVVTNRWGKEVFVSDNYQNNWDGLGAADGIYFYRLQVADNESLTGWLEIIRGPKP